MIAEDCSKLGSLSAINSENLELMLSWRNAPNVRANMYTRHEISPTEHLEWWERIKERRDQQYFMYVFQSTPLGVVAFNGIDFHSRNSSWAFYAAPDAPKGTGSRMEFIALDHAFQAMGLHKLHCEVLAFNKPVIRLHQKFGFKIEGILREQHRVEESFIDIFRLGLLSSEWSQLREHMFNKLMQISFP